MISVFQHLERLISFLQHYPHFLLLLEVLLELVLDLDERWPSLLVLVQTLLHYVDQQRVSYLRIVQMMILVVAHQSNDLVLRQPLVRNFFSQHLPNNNSKAVYICLLVYLILASDNLWSHPLISPNSFVFLLFLLLPG